MSPYATKTGHCPFCAAHTMLHALSTPEGETVWACKDVTNPALPDFTCHAALKMALHRPLPITIADF